MSASAAPLTLERMVPARAEEVTAAWSSGERLAIWLHLARGRAPRRAEVESDGSFELEYGGGATGGHTILRGRALERTPARLVFEILLQTDVVTAVSRLAVELQASGGMTKVRLRHDGLDDELRAQAEGVWRYALGRIVGACPAAMSDYFDRFERAPGFQSPFGGFWPDASDFAARLAAKRAGGQLTDADEESFRHWHRHGFVVLPGAVSTDLIEAFRAEVAEDWRTGNPAITVELNDGSDAFPRMAPHYEHLPHKVLDYHSVSRRAREIQFAPPIRRFLGQLFERAPMAFQSLLFRYGTEQEMHQDTAYVVVRSPMQFVGCWVALEDIAPGTGELQYYGGSHRIPEFLWLGRGRSRPPGFDDHGPFLDHVREQSEHAGCPLIRFHPKKGDAVVWHADLVHGGSRREQRDRTRWSLVTHYCPVDVDPEWMARVAHSGRLAHAEDCWYCFAHRPEAVGQP